MTSESEKYESDWVALHNQSHRFLIVSTDGLAINSYYWICHSKEKTQKNKRKRYEYVCAVDELNSHIRVFDRFSSLLPVKMNSSFKAAKQSSSWQRGTDLKIKLKVKFHSRKTFQTKLQSIFFERVILKLGIIKIISVIRNEKKWRVKECVAFYIHRGFRLYYCPHEKKALLNRSKERVSGNQKEKHKIFKQRKIVVATIEWSKWKRQS